MPSEKWSAAILTWPKPFVGFAISPLLWSEYFAKLLFAGKWKSTGCAACVSCSSQPLAGLLTMPSKKHLIWSCLATGQYHLTPWCSASGRSNENALWQFQWWLHNSVETYAQSLMKLSESWQLVCEINNNSGMRPVIFLFKSLTPNPGKIQSWW